MIQATINGKTFDQFTRNELEDELLFALACGDWHDLSHDIPDPEAIESWGWGSTTGKHSIHVLSKYEDGEIVLASINNERPEWKRSGAEQFKLQWLWDTVTGQ